MQPTIDERAADGSVDCFARIPAGGVPDTTMRKCRSRVAGLPAIFRTIILLHPLWVAISGSGARWSLGARSTGWFVSFWPRYFRHIRLRFWCWPHPSACAGFGFELRLESHVKPPLATAPTTPCTNSSARCLNHALIEYVSMRSHFSWTGQSVLRSSSGCVLVSSAAGRFHPFAGVSKPPWSNKREFGSPRIDGNRPSKDCCG